MARAPCPRVCADANLSAIFSCSERVSSRPLVGNTNDLQFYCDAMMLPGLFVEYGPCFSSIHRGPFGCENMRQRELLAIGRIR